MAEDHTSTEGLKITSHTTLEKWWGEPVGKPYQVLTFDGNIGLNDGITNACNLICGLTAMPYNAANARIGIGNGTAAAVASQTGLQGGSTLYVAMNASYPSVSGQTMTFQADFGTGQANFAWQEWTIDNGASAALNLNRKVQSQGTKTSAETWRFTAAVSMS